MNSPLRHANRRGSFALIVIIALVLLVAAGGTYYYYGMYRVKDVTADLITAVVEKDKFQHFVLEQGEVESSKNVEVICNVEARNREGTAILWVIEEGARVKKGDKLVELDSSALEQEIKQQRIVVNSSRAMKISAESALEQAKVAREEYLEGQFKQEEQQIESEILEKEETLSRAKETAVFAEELAAQGFQSRNDLRADRFNVQSNQVQLDLAKNKLRTLREITKRKMLIGFDADIETAKAKFESEVSSHQEEIEKLAELEEQLEYCVIYAPEDGQVVHANRYSSRGGSAEFVVEAGSTVRERQTIIRLPDPDHMQIKAKINESMISLVREEMPVRVQIGAFEENALGGIVTKVNKYAAPSSWFSSSVKEYETLVRIIDPPPEVRTGMTAEVQILVNELDDATLIPVQALINYRAHYFCLVLNGKSTETREVKIGPTDDKVVVIESGLKEGEKVVMNPKNHNDLLNLPDLPEVEVERSKRPGGSAGAAPGRVANNPAARGGRPGAGGRPGGPGGKPGGQYGAAGGRPGGGRPGGPGGKQQVGGQNGRPGGPRGDRTAAGGKDATVAQDAGDASKRGGAKTSGASEE